ncbi:hypothetical protein E2320_003010 [Naja naja]|nr:hypothetical protein E2320_003010 [Naja naja]
MGVTRMILFVFLFCITCKTYAINCGIPDDPLPIPHQFAQPGNVILGMLTFGTFTPIDEKNVFPSLYQMVPNEIHQYNGIIQLLQHFGWIWIGIMTVDDDYGDMFLQKIEPLLFQNSICYAFLLRTSPKAYIDEYIHLMSMVLRYDQLFMDDKVKLTFEHLLHYMMKNVFPSLYQMVPNEIHQYNGIIQLLQHFGWIWIGIMAVDDDYGDMFLQKIEPLLFKTAFVMLSYLEHHQRHI